MRAQGTLTGESMDFGHERRGITAMSRRASRRAFTLIELIVVLAIVALLLTLAVPRYFQSIDRAKEAVLRQNLAQMREAIDRFYGDRGRYPDTIEELAARQYLRRIPPDPITESAATWIALPPAPPESGRVYDVRSGANGAALDGTLYATW